MNEPDPKPQPTPPSPSPPFQFTLRTLLLLFVVLGSSLAVFGGWGMPIFVLAVWLTTYVRSAESLSSLAWFFVIVLCPCLPSLFLMLSAAIHWMLGPNWPHIAALAVWLASVGALLVGAVRGRKARSEPPLPAC